MAQTRFDQYRSTFGLLQIPDYVASPERRLLAQQLDFQVLQSSMMAQMGDTLNSIGAEMAAAHSESLAVQQEMLQREKFQEMVEELIYQTEKMVAAFSEPTCDVPLAQRYFGLQGVLDTVEQFEIQTSIIRGRDNKAAFERAMDGARRLCSELKKHSEVRDTIAFIESEQERTERLEEEQEAKKEAKLTELAAEIASLQSAKKSESFRACYKSFFWFFFFWEKMPGVPITQNVVKLWFAAVTFFVQIPLWVAYGFLWIPLVVLVMKALRNSHNKPLDAKIAALQAKLAQLEDEEAENDS